jgi:hypothetical protein
MPWQDGSSLEHQDGQIELSGFAEVWKSARNQSIPCGTNIIEILVIPNLSDFQVWAPYPGGRKALPYETLINLLVSPILTGLILRGGIMETIWKLQQIGSQCHQIYINFSWERLPHG